MSNSPLATYTKLSQFHSGSRQSKIDRISPHCVVGQCTIENLGEWFSNPIAQCSSNYGIGKDGRIGLIVEEGNRSWCTSSKANDQRAVTIECASDKTHPYTMYDVVYQSLIKLCIDICKRNGKTKLLWISDKAKALNYAPKTDEMLITVHRWFANKPCPGDWLYSRLPDLAAKVTAALGGAVQDDPGQIDESNSDLLRKGSAGSLVLELQKDLNKLGYGLSEDGDFGPKTETAVIDFQKKAGLDPDGIVGPLTQQKLKGQTSDGSFGIRVKISDLNIRSGPGSMYSSKGFIPPGVYTIVEERKNGSVTWGRLKSGAGWICLSYAERI